jgi:hypothetical protein
MNNHEVSRRTFVELLMCVAAGGVIARPASAADAQKLDVKYPAAVALGYVEDASHVDSKKYPAYIKGSNCENCLQLQGKPGNDYRPCTTFGGKLVAVGGWCSGWTAEM